MSLTQMWYITNLNSRIRELRATLHVVISMHLTHETCMAFLLSCKNNAKLLQKQHTRKILCGNDTINVSSSIYKKRLAEYTIYKAYNKRKRCIERAVRSMRFHSFSEDYSEEVESTAKSMGILYILYDEFYNVFTSFGAVGEYKCSDTFEGTKITLSMFHDTKDIDKELPCPRYPIEKENYEEYG